jgi:hypothetical protein
MMQRLDARSFIFHPQLSVSIFLALVLKVRRNRFRCHGQSVAEPSPSKLCNFSHFNNSLLIRTGPAASTQGHRLSTHVPSAASKRWPVAESSLQGATSNSIPLGHDQ